MAKTDFKDFNKPFPPEFWERYMIQELLVESQIRKSDYETWKRIYCR